MVNNLYYLFARNYYDKSILRLLDIKKHFWSFGLALGLAAAFIWTLIIVVWEWIENPSGIFHNQNGTNWTFIYDTAISWFFPIFINVTIISAVVHLLFSGIKRFFKNRNKL